MHTLPVRDGFAGTNSGRGNRQSQKADFLRSLKIVKSGSLNEVHVPEQLAAEYRHTRSCMKDPSASGCRHPHAAMVSQPLTFREFPGWAVTPIITTSTFCNGLNPSNKATCEDGLTVTPRWEALRFTNITPLPNAAYDGRRFRFPSGHMSVPFKQMSEDTALYVLDYSIAQPFGNASESTLFDIDDDGSIHPAWDHSLSLGVRQGPTPRFNNSCRVCHEISPNGEVQCLGGSHFTVKSGFMLQHEPAEQGVSLFRCPNQQACPLGHFSLTAEGQPQIRTAICAEGYNDTKPGCVQCLPGFGRLQYDPFKCERCVDAGTLQRVLTTLSSSALLYGMALRSAKCEKKTKSQLILKIFLSFSTIASRCVSAIPYARNYQKMQEMAANFVVLLHSLVASVGYALEEGAGGCNLVVDCLGPSEGHASLALGMAFDFSAPVVLLVGAYLYNAIFTNGPLSFKQLLVWGTVFLPALFGAVAKSFPCVQMSEDGKQFLMYDIYYDTECAGSFYEWLGLPRAWRAIQTGGCLVLMGPLLWLRLTACSDWEEHAESTGFLTAGYEEGKRWWEAVVLLRKAGIYTIAVLIPLSFAPGAHILALLLVVILAEMLQAWKGPYEDPHFDVLEAQVLGISAACLTLVALLIVEWPFISTTVSLAILLLLVVLMSGTCFYLLAAFASAYVEEEASTFRLPWPVSFVLHRGQEAGLYRLPSSVTAILHEGCGGPPPEKDEEAEEGPEASASGKVEGSEVAAPQEEEQQREPPGSPGGGEVEGAEPVKRRSKEEKEQSQ